MTEAGRSGGAAYHTPAAPLRALADELARAGVRDVVICPGSRSTPLALALRLEPRLRCWVHLDERAGGFFALGAAKASGRPVAVLVTSGTAAVELSPAVVEASYGTARLSCVTAVHPRPSTRSTSSGASQGGTPNSPCRSGARRRRRMSVPSSAAPSRRRWRRRPGPSS